MDDGDGGGGGGVVHGMDMKAWRLDRGERPSELSDLSAVGRV